MERIYLYVPPEEYAEVKASGACWDEHSKRWYVPQDRVSAAWSRWLADGYDAEFGFESEEAFVAAAQVSWSNCREKIEVICIYCQSGRDLETDEALEQFTVSNISSMDSALAMTLERWRFYSTAMGTRSEDGYFANHCRGGAGGLSAAFGAGVDRVYGGGGTDSGERGLRVWGVKQARPRGENSVRVTAQSGFEVLIGYGMRY